MADEGKIFRLNPLDPMEQQLASGMYSAILAGVLKTYRQFAGPQAYEEIKANLVLRIKNNEIGGVGLPADHAIATHILQVVELAFHAADQP